MPPMRSHAPRTSGSPSAARSRLRWRQWIERLVLCAFEKEEILTAHFYCWEPALDIRPERWDFTQRLTDAQNQTGSHASTTLMDFVAALLAKYPDFSTT